MPKGRARATQRPSALAAWPQLRRVPIARAVLAEPGTGSLADGVATSTRLHRKDPAVIQALGLPARRAAMPCSGRPSLSSASHSRSACPSASSSACAAWHTLTEQPDLDSTELSHQLPLAPEASPQQGPSSRLRSSLRAGRPAAPPVWNSTPIKDVDCDNGHHHRTRCTRTNTGRSRSTPRVIPPRGDRQNVRSERRRRILLQAHRTAPPRHSWLRGAGRR